MRARPCATMLASPRPRAAPSTSTGAASRRCCTRRGGTAAGAGRTSPREVVKMLVERGANPNQQLYYQAVARTILGADTGRGTTPFLTACANGDIEIVKLLLAHGAKRSMTARRVTETAKARASIPRSNSSDC